MNLQHLSLKIALYGSLFILTSYTKSISQGSDSLVIFRGFNTDVSEDSTILIDLYDYFYDSSGLNPYTFSIVSGSQYIDLDLNQSSLTITPEPHYFGSQSFVIRATNAIGDEEEGTFHVYFISENDVPEILGSPKDTVIHLFGEAYYYISDYFKDNDNLYGTGDPFNITVNTDTSLISYTINRDTLRLKPRNYVGNILVNLTVTDSANASAEVSFNVNAGGRMNIAEKYNSNLATDGGAFPLITMEKSNREVIALQRHEVVYLINNQGKMVTQPLFKSNHNSYTNLIFNHNVLYSYGWLLGAEGDVGLSIIYNTNNSWDIKEITFAQGGGRFLTYDFDLELENPYEWPFLSYYDSTYHISTYSDQNGVTEKLTVPTPNGAYVKKVIQSGNNYACVWAIIDYSSGSSLFRPQVYWMQRFDSNGVSIGSPYEIFNNPDQSDTTSYMVEITDFFEVHGQYELIWSRRSFREFFPFYRTVFDSNFVPIVEAQPFPDDFVGGTSKNIQWDRIDSESYKMYIGGISTAFVGTSTIRPVNINTRTNSISWEWTGAVDSNYVNFQFKNGNYINYTYQPNSDNSLSPYPISLEYSDPTSSIIKSGSNMKKSNKNGNLFILNNNILFNDKEKGDFYDLQGRRIIEK